MSSYKGLPTLEVLEGAWRYNTWISEAILPHLHSPILEVGAGTGNISSIVLRHHSLYVSDVDEYLVNTLKKKLSKNGNVNCEKLDITKNNSRFTNYFSSLYAINVLEHIDDDLQALKNMYSLLNDGGTLVILVPAKQNVYSRLDKVLGHYRRYEKEGLKIKVEEAGFIVKKIYFFNFLGLISWRIRDLFDKRSIHLSSTQIALFDTLVPLLKRVEKYFHIPIGISLIVVARKPNEK